MSKKDNNSDQFLEEGFDFSKASKGPIVSGSGVKLPVSIRLDGEVIDYFKDKATQLEGKAKYQTLINEALKEYIAGNNIKQLLLSQEFAEQLASTLKKFG